MAKPSSAAIIGGGDQANRKESDFYPTPIEGSIVIAKFLKELIKTGVCPEIKTVWEPCCGNGAMSKVLESEGFDVFSTELRADSGYGAGGLNFLQHQNPGCDAIITNPPFNLAEDFIFKAISCSPVVAMLLKSQYWHARERLKMFRDHTPAYICPLTWRLDFGGGGSPTMDTMWTFWIKGNHGATYHPLQKPSLQDQLF